MISEQIDLPSHLRDGWLMRRFYSLILCLCSLLTAPAYASNVLDRSGLAPTFTEEFDTLRNYVEDPKTRLGTGIWRRNFGYKWCDIDDVKNHSLIWNEEEQLYVDPSFAGDSGKPLGLEAASVKDGILRITATKAPADAPYGYKYFSGLLTSEPSFSQTYGVFEIRAKLPKGKGLWPAFWLLPVSKKWPPEIDVMEVLGDKITQYHTTLHSKASGKHEMSPFPPHATPDLSADFHTYAVDWGPKEIVFYFDEAEVARSPTPADMHQPFYMLINLAVGGKWPGSPDASTAFPATMEVDWVRAWARTDYHK